MVERQIVALDVVGSSPTILPFLLGSGFVRPTVCCVMRRATCDGVSPSGKARDFDSRIVGSIPATPAIGNTLLLLYQIISPERSVSNSIVRYWNASKNGNKKRLS